MTISNTIGNIIALVLACMYVKTELRDTYAIRGLEPTTSLLGTRV